MSNELDIARATLLHRMATAGIGTELHTDSPDWVARVANAIRAERQQSAMLEALRNTLAAYISAMANEYDYPGSDWLEREGNADPVVIAARAALAAAEGGEAA